MRVLEFFSCSGGMAEGLRRAGLDVSMAFDHDPDACASYEVNMRHRPVRVDVADVMRMVRAGWSAGPIDLLVADPPCTPWSRAGKRKGADDERDMLPETVELISALRPRSYLIANVPGLDDSTNWPVVQATIGALSRHGYCVRDFVRLDAADYGVPQHRVRPFWFGHLHGPCVRWPEPTHGDPANLALPGCELEPWVTVRQALGHLSGDELGRSIRLRRRDCTGTQHGSVADRPARVVGTSNLSDGNVLLSDRRRSDGTLRDSIPDAPATTIRAGRSSSERLVDAPTRRRRSKPDHKLSSPDAPARTLTRNSHSDGALLEHHSHPISRPNEPSYTITTKGDGRGAQGACVVEWPWDRPSTTVTTRYGVAPPGHHPESGSIMSQPGAVVLSERAAAILQGFPDGWHFVGKTKRARWSQIGQAMPPPLAEAVARAIAEQLRATRTEAA